MGTSAGGARAKAVIAWNPTTHAVRSGQVDAGAGFEYWILKFDGVSGNRDRDLDLPQGYGAIEYAYANMARAAGITMSDCRMLEENGRRHFMTRRFDRPGGSAKVHMQSLGALAHFDFNQAGAYSYEEALQVIRRLALPMDAIEQQFRRMAFNVIARNQDDHVKNIALLMDRSGDWSLSPAFDMTYSYSPDGFWTRQHQMSLNGKRDDFILDDFRQCAESASMKRGRPRRSSARCTASWPSGRPSPTRRECRNETPSRSRLLNGSTWCDPDGRLGVAGNGDSGDDLIRSAPTVRRSIASGLPQ